MSIHLATKGTLDGGITHATKGMIYLSGVVEWAISILPQFIVRRVAVQNVVQRISVSKVSRREDD